MTDFDVPPGWSIPRGVRYDGDRARKAERFFERYCCHIKGEWAGQPFKLADWQARRIVRPVFGLVHEDGTRLIRTCFVEIPRKNGKSLLASGVANKLLFADGEPGAEVYSAAADKEQAALVYDVAAAMIEESPELRQRSRIFRGNVRRIVNLRTHGFYRVISADARRAHGFNSHGVMGDELHVWGGSYVGSLLEALITSTGSRRQPLVFLTTTAGFDAESICFREYSRACQIRDGVLEDPTYLPVIFEAPRDADFTDPDVWALANPNLGVSVRRSYLEDAAQRALETPADENAFRRLHLNQWTEQKTRWIPKEAWDACADPDCGIPDGAATSAALDLSTKEDTTAFVAAWRAGDGRLVIRGQVFVPEEVASKKERTDHVPYRAWADAGYVTLTPGNVVDYDTIADHVERWNAKHPISTCGFDPWQGEMLRQQLEKLGIQTAEFRQGWRTMGEPTAMFGRLWKSRQLAHDGNPVGRWQASNVAVLEDPAGNLKPAKNLSGDRIDLVVAAIMAAWLELAGDVALSAAEVTS